MMLSFKKATPPDYASDGVIVEVKHMLKRGDYSTLLNLIHDDIGEVAFNKLLSDTFGLKTKAGANNRGYMVSVDGQKAPSHVHPIVEMATDEARRILRRMPVPSTARVLKIEAVLESRDDIVER